MRVRLMQGSSPDEVALVDGARQLGFEFVGINGADYIISFSGVRATFQVRWQLSRLMEPSESTASGQPHLSGIRRHSCIGSLCAANTAQGEAHSTQIRSNRRGL